MKGTLKKWEKPAVEVIKLDADDVITTSLTTAVDFDWGNGTAGSWDTDADGKTQYRDEKNQFGV
ncbi:MAG: hypothetical protein IJY04_07615 [Clostridia bacterium]|nr:hypothetical protein [Clostridia bacterium]